MYLVYKLFVLAYDYTKEKQMIVNIYFPSFMGWEEVFKKKGGGGSLKPKGRSHQRCRMLKIAIKINGGLINNLLVLPTGNIIQFKSDRLLL